MADGARRRRLRLGMVGGGQGAFIGAAHRIAARLDDRFELVAGAFSSDPERSRASAAELGVAPERAYGHWLDMASAEPTRPDGIDAVAIVTPNHLHFAPAKSFVEAGVDVICDKPMTFSLDEALELMEVVRRTGRVFVLTQNYTGYPMVRHARQLVQNGALGTIRQVQVAYAQDWLTDPIEREGQKQAAWRTDPARAGAGGSLGDIGVHAFNLAAFVTGLELESVCADLRTHAPGRVLDDNANVLLRYRGGASGMLWASQVAPGANNRLTIGVYGDLGGLEWAGETPDELRFAPFGTPAQTIVRGGPWAGEAAAAATRLPPGHPEGFLEAFANLYADAAEQIWARIERRPTPPAAMLAPTVEDGARGLKFIEACVASNAAGGAWVSAALPSV